jgi:hypothetical protein
VGNWQEWEREARTDGMSAIDLRTRKAGMVEELNALLAIKQGMTHADARKNELLTGATSTSWGDQHARNQVSVVVCGSRLPLWAHATGLLAVSKP